MDPIHWTPEQQNANDSKKLSLGILSAVQDSADRTESGLVGLQDAIHTSTQESTDVIASLLDQATSDQRVGINKLEEIKSSSLVSNQILKVIAGKDNSDVVEKLTSIESILSIPEKETDLSPVVIAQNEGVSAITSAIGTLTEAVNNKEYPQFPDIPEQKETVKIDGEVKVSKPSWYSPVDLSGIKTTLEKIAGKEMPKFEFPDFKKILSPIQSILEKIAEKKIPEIPMKDGYIKVTVDRVGGGGLSQPESIALRAVATEETLATIEEALATIETSTESIESRDAITQYLASLITRDQAQATDGSKRVTVLNALQLNSINPPSSSTAMLIYSWTQDLSRVSVATNLISNIK